MRNITYIVLFLLFESSAEGRAQETPVLVELFTSQGCSVCPRADEALGALASRAGVVALTLNVDYWDYLGWGDEFAKEEYTKRQRAYGKANGRRTLYTPQLFVDGQPLPPGASFRELERRLEVRAEVPRPVQLGIRRDGQSLTIAVAPAGPSAEPADVHVALFEPAMTTQIGAGENAGRRATYYNVVTDWRTVARWDGREKTEIKVPLPPGQAAAVIIQSKGAGPVLAAARLR